MFTAVRSNRISQDVVEQIQNAILSGEMAPGDKLPPERELKEMFSISRGTLREALRVLEQKGLIDIQLGAGGGAVAREITAELVTDSLSLLLRNKHVPLNHLQEFRKDIESNIARLAALRATAKEVSRLREILAQAKDSLDNHEGWEAYVEADALFHMTLAQITDNPIYAYIQTAIHENINLYYDEFLEHDERLLRYHYKDLCAIAEAIADGDADLACNKMRQHLSRLTNK